VESAAPARKFSGKAIILTAIFLGLILAVLAVFGFGLRGKPGVFRLFHLRQERDRLEQLNRRLREENDKLARTIERLQVDREMIEDLIRRELNFVKDNDLIFQMPQEKGTSATQPHIPPAARARQKSAAHPDKAAKSSKLHNKAKKAAKRSQPPAKSARPPDPPAPEKKP
jgi:cell division protein FtsB